MWNREWLEQTGRDIRYAARSLRRAPAFAAVVLLILAVGIGMSTAMFTTFQTILIRRLPVADQDRVAIIWPYRVPGAEIAPPVKDLTVMAHDSRTMRSIAGVAHWQSSTQFFVHGSQVVSLIEAPVTANFFTVLGARPALGRLPRPEDGAAGTPGAIVLSHRIWLSQFNGDAAAIGQTLYDPYSRIPYRIVGVAPAGLDYPVGTDCWLSLGARDSAVRVFAVARLAPGTSLGAANSEYFSIISRLEPTLKLTGSSVQSLTTAVVGDVRPVITALAAAVALLLVIACVNVGSLFLVRAGARTRELSVRRAIGATQGDLVRQLVTESAILAVGGGILGALCAGGLIRTLVRLAPAQLPRLDEVALHGNVLAAAMAVTAGSVLLFGVLPALLGARVNPSSVLRHDERSGMETRQRRRLRDFLVSSQVALALVMLAGGGLLVRSLWRMEGLDLGYRSARLSIMSVAYDPQTLSVKDTALAAQEANAIAVDETFERHMLAVPGVTGVTPIMTPPFLGAGINVGLFEAEGQTAADAERIPALPGELAGPRYFETFDIPIRRGRGFTDADRVGAPLVVVISESVAKRLWPGENPLGKRMRYSSAGMTAREQEQYAGWRTVVGIVGDTHFRVFKESSPTVYVPWRQMPGAVWGVFAIRTSGQQPHLARDIRHELGQLTGHYTLLTLSSLDQLLDKPLAEPRLSTLLLGGFGAVALLLAALGLYGVMTSAVREQTRELGIRVALGATPHLIRRIVVDRALRVTGTGALVGMACALVGTRLLRSQLFRVSPFDPATLISVSIILLGVALAAAYVPARRATRVDPMTALRAD